MAADVRRRNAARGRAALPLCRDLAGRRRSVAGGPDRRNLTTPLPAAVSAAPQRRLTGKALRLGTSPALLVRSGSRKNVCGTGGGDLCTARSMRVEYKMIGGDGREYGPATLEEVREWSVDGRLAHGTPVWRSDEARWQPAGSWPELRWDLRSPVPPPELVEVAPLVEEELVPAGLWVRMAAYFIDTMVLTSLVMVATTPWSEELAKIAEAAFAQLKAPAPDMAVVARWWLISVVIDLPMSFLYFVGFNTLRGATPGKQILGLRILDADGSRLTFGRAVIRHCGEWLSKLTFGIGFLLVAFTPKKRALHDLLARTQVVFDRRGRR